MKDQFRINPIRSEVMGMKKKKPIISRAWYVWFFAGTATMSLGMVILFWHTTVFQDAILAQLELKNGTQTFAWWETPPVKPLLRVRIFNYTNVEDYESGKASKLHTEEVGPYIYRETRTKINVRLNGNGTVSYQEKITHEWEFGGRSDDEMICVPNIPLIMAVKLAKEYPSFHIPITMLLTVIGGKPFKVLTVREFLWGYDDNLFDSVMQIMSWTGEAPFKKFGMLMARSGVSKDRLTIHTGSDDINNLGKYQSVNGMEIGNIWDDKECDRIDGTDGSMFPPNLVSDRNATLAIYTREMCRKFPLRFHGFGKSFDIPTLRYKPAEDVFTSTNTTNSCFCKKSLNGESPMIQKCAPPGTFNLADCSYGVPLLMSFPHFYNGDKSLLDHVDGLQPCQSLHETYADIHPRLGVVIGGWSRIQMSAQVTVMKTLPVLDSLKDGLILPILWFEIGVDDMPDEVLSSLRQAYFTAGTVESTLQWGSLLCTILSMCAMAFMMKKRSEIERPKWQNTVSLKTGF